MAVHPPNGPVAWGVHLPTSVTTIQDGAMAGGDDLSHRVDLWQQLHGALDATMGDSAAEPIAAVARRLLARGGSGAVLAVLGALNARTRFRFTGLYRIEPPVLRNVVLFDRENPLVRAGGECSVLDDTYCSLVGRSGRPFMTPDAPNDPRLGQHAARTSVLSYVGVPVRGRSGRIEGTLCHFDARPRLAPVGEIGVLESVAVLLADALGA